MPLKEHSSSHVAPAFAAPGIYLVWPVVDVTVLHVPRAAGGSVFACKCGIHCSAEPECFYHGKIILNHEGPHLS